MSLAKAFGKKGDDSKSMEYYLKAAELSESEEDKFNIWIKLAKTAKNSGKYSSTRDYARKALAINSNSGEAYLLIGDAYAASASSCGSGDLGRGGVYLVAVDKYLKARSVDPSVAEAANAKISKYSAYFPGKEDAFFKNINNGDTYTVGCWIGESTIVRTIGG
jgi:tetratricopeptide (TPR) repeat protein